MNDIITTLDTGAAALASSRVEEARVLLAESRDLDEVLKFRDVHLAMVFYAKRRKDAASAHGDAFVIAEEANRRLGQLIKEMPQHPTGGGRPKKRKAGDEETSPVPEAVSKSAELKRLGISWGEAGRLEKIGDIPEEEWRQRVNSKRAKIEKSSRASHVGSVSAAVDYDGDAYGTPALYVEPARKVLGGRIGVDPASNAMAQNVIRAERFYTKDDSGLVSSWSSEARTLWMNPPYSRGLILQFAVKFVHEYRDQRAFDAAIVLVNSSTEAGWYQLLAEHCDAMQLPDKRIAFELNGRPVEDNRYAQTFFYFGTELQQFHAEFSPLGKVFVPLRGFA